MIIKTVSFYDFADAFRDYDRAEHFSYDALDMIYRYLDEVSDDTGEPIELDVIAICCDFTEQSVDDVIADYLIPIDEGADDDAKIEAVQEYLEYNTSFLGFTESGNAVYIAF